MKRVCSFALVMLLAFGALGAHAKRLGDGKSVGQQSSPVMQHEATRPVTSAAAAQSPATVLPPAAASPKRPWGAMLGGLAAGLGLAWLAHSLGLGESFGQFLMVGLLLTIALLAFGAFMRSRRVSSSSSFPMRGAGPSNPLLARTYSPENVGNDASARPWERTSTFGTDAAQSGRFQAGEHDGVVGSALLGNQAWGVPSDFDSTGFLKAAKQNFVSLQDAWDRSDIASLRAMMTDSMLVEIQSQLAEREAHTGASPNKTEVVMLEAHLLGIEDMGQGYMASVEFSGLIREDFSSGPSAFREVWNMAKTKAGDDGWLVAGVQALQ